MNSVLEVNNLNKSYYTLSGKVKALDNVSFKIDKGEFVAIVGTSGCGKSTLLNIIAGIDNNYSGDVNIKGKVGYMLQSDALLPWLTIKDNALLPKKFNYDIDEVYINKLLTKYKLNEFKDKLPNCLSGGMKQRVAFIRTLATNPDILLLDEPFSALDYQTRLLLENDIYNYIKKERKTALIVTHDLAEACALANRIIVLSKRPGKVKNVYNIELKKRNNPIKNRSDEKFNYYFNLIWGDLDNND